MKNILKVYNTVITLLLFVIGVFMATTSCTKNNPINPIIEETQEITLRLKSYVVDEVLNDFINNYTVYDLKFVEYYQQDVNIVIFSYNSLILEETVFLDMLRNDERVLRAELEPFDVYITNQICIHLNRDVKGESLSQFLEDYIDFDLNIEEYYNVSSNIIIFSFNNTKIDEIILLEMIKYDTRVIKAEFEPFNDESLLLHIQVHEINDIYDIILSYDIYNFNLKIKEILFSTNEIWLSFNLSTPRGFMHTLFLHDQRINGMGLVVASDSIILRLQDYVIDDILEEFIFSYSKYELRLGTPSQYFNWRSCFFNNELINVWEMLDLVKRDERVFDASFSGAGVLP